MTSVELMSANVRVAINDEVLVDTPVEDLSEPVVFPVGDCHGCLTIVVEAGEDVYEGSVSL